MKTIIQTIDLDRYSFSFGKYKGKSIRDVIDEDAEYVVWCHENVRGFTLKDTDYQEVLKEMDRQGNQWDTGMDMYMWEYDDWGDRD